MRLPRARMLLTRANSSTSISVVRSSPPLLLTPDEEAWVVCIGQEQQLVLGVLPEDILTLLIFLDAEALDVMVLLIGIVVDGRPDLAGLILLDAQEVLLDMNGVAEVGGIAFARLEDDEDAVTGVEGAEVLTPARCSSGAGHRGRTIRHDHRASRNPYSGVIPSAPLPSSLRARQSYAT